MAIAVEGWSRESELCALRLQEEELLAQQDALLAQRLALAYTLNVEPDAVDQLVVELGIGFPGLADAVQLESQLAELRVKADQLHAESVQESLAAKVQEAQESRSAAEIVNEQERWHAAVASHDAAFARRLAAVDEETWEVVGDNIEEPLHLPPPPQLPMPAENCETASAAAASPSDGTRRSPQQPTVSTRGGQEHAAPTHCPTPSGTHRASSPTQTSHASQQASTPGKHGGKHPQASGPTGPAAAAEATVGCLSCCDRFPAHQVLCAGADAAGTSTAAAGCGHYFCSECMSAYVLGAVKDRKCPVPCPMAGAGGAAAGRGAGRGGCGARIPRDTVLGLLEEHPEEAQIFRQSEAASALDPARTIYCPHKACSSPLVRPDDLPPDQPTSCPACQRAFCPRCLVPGWHQGYICEDFQKLPAHLRSAEDAAMLQYSARQQWKRCPQCQQMVERSEGCNHMLCRCSCSFCYACGERYRDTKPTAGNVHGTPGCGCPLFSVPAEQGQDDGDAAAAAAAPAPPRVARMGLVHAIMPRPRRGGREISRQRCRRSASILDCPFGNKCWFWHDEDGPQ